MASTPICRCRVLYLGSAVPHVTKDGLHGIQEPLRELYPEEGVQGAKGIDSWLSIWSNGLLLENVDEKNKRVARFFPIDSLHYCAAVRHVTIPGPDGEPVERFLPLDSPFSRIPTLNNPPLFACILRRVTGIKVLECHAFVCKKEMAANALVRCCFHSYADNTYAKHLENGSIYGSIAGGQVPGPHTMTTTTNGNVNPIQKVEQWRAFAHEPAPKDDSDLSHDNGELVSIYEGGGDENHKVWVSTDNPFADDQHSIYADYASTIRSVKSTNGAGRSNRPRQLMTPSNPPPPPPMTTTRKSSITDSKNIPNGKKKDVASNKQRNGQAIISNGHHPPPARWYPPPMAVSEFRPTMWPPRMKPHKGPHPLGLGYPAGGMPPPQPPPMTPHHHHYKMGGRGPPYPVPIPQVPPKGFSPPKSPGPRSTEEPIYLPSARAMSPVASYQPGVFPYEQYYLNQHAGGHPYPLPPHQSNNPHTGSNGVQPAPQIAKLTKYKKNKIDKNGSDSDSKFNTGIYRKKGHLNERAFSYSIRQEHRSRSHNSLTTLNFGDPLTNNGANGSFLPPGSDNTNGVADDNLVNTMANGHHDNHPHPLRTQNGKTPTLDHPRLNGHHSHAVAATNGHGSPQPHTKSSTGTRQRNKVKSKTKNQAKVDKMMNDLSLSDGEIEDSGPSADSKSRRKKGMAINSRA